MSDKFYTVAQKTDGGTDSLAEILEKAVVTKRLSPPLLREKHQKIFQNKTFQPAIQFKISSQEFSNSVLPERFRKSVFDRAKERDLNGRK